MEKVELKVEGMTCGGCVKSIQNALNGRNGVDNAVADLEAGTVALQHPSVIDVVQLVQAPSPNAYCFRTTGIINGIHPEDGIFSLIGCNNSFCIDHGWSPRKVKIMKKAVLDHVIFSLYI